MKCYNLSDQTRNNILRELLRTAFDIWKELLSHKISYEFRRVQMVMFLCPIWLKLTGCHIPFVLYFSFNSNRDIMSTT